MERSILANGRAICAMVMVNKRGQTEPDTKETGVLTKRMARGLFGILRATCTKDIGKTTRLTDMACIHIQMVPNIRATGKMIFSMAGVWRSGRTVRSTKVLTRKAGSMGRDLTSGRTGRSTWATGRRTRFTDTASTSGLMAVVTLATGQTTIWTDTECTPGGTAENTRAIMCGIASMATASTLGLTVAGTKDSGRTVVSTEKAITVRDRVQSLEEASGLKVKDKNGLIDR